MISTAKALRAIRALSNFCWIMSYSTSAAAAASSADAVSEATIIFVLGASGDLACKKTFPAIFDLYRDKLLPPRTKIIGYARTEMPAEHFHELMQKALLKGETKLEDVTAFLELVSYCSGPYNSAAALGKVRTRQIARCL